jgi:hypothetical protein
MALTKVTLELDAAALAAIQSSMQLAQVALQTAIANVNGQVTAQLAAAAAPTPAAPDLKLVEK